ncbi:MAG: S1 RNA-binding domain-containing protein [Candidatus Izemoplasmataceae bacterium]
MQEFNLKNIQEGQTVKGKVYKVKDDEVIVDIGYTTEGTISLENLTRQNYNSCHELVKEGDDIEAVVKKKDDESGIVLLSRLEVEEAEMFDELQNKFENDEVFEATVKEHNKGGLIVKAFGFDMFMPAREVSKGYTENLSDYVGKTLDVKIIEISRRKIVVSHRAVEKALEKAEKDKELEKIQEGDVVKGKVSKLMPYGAFIRFGHVEGLLHISEMSHHRIKQPSEILKEGDEVEVKVIEAKGKKRGLSLKALQPTPWEAFAKNHKVGDKVTGKVVKKMQFGILVEVERDVAGIIHKNDYSWDPRFNLAGNVSVGDEVEAQILSMEPEKGRMQLSKKHLEYNPWDDVEVKVGEVVSGEVKTIQSNGALVEVQGVYGFLPIGEISEKRIDTVEEVLKEGDVINAIVLKFNKKDWQMVLSKKRHDEQKVRDEYKKHLKSENKKDQSQTLGELFAEKFKNMKK